MYKKIALSFITSSFLATNVFSFDKDVALKYKNKIVQEQCMSDTIDVKTFSGNVGNIENVKLDFKGPTINCNGEVEFDIDQFEEMGDKFKKLLKDVLSNAQLFAEAEAKKDAIEGIVSTIAYFIVFTPQTPTDAMNRITAVTDCVTSLTSEGVKADVEAGGGDESLGTKIGVNMGELGKLGECAKKAMFPAGMTDEEEAHYIKVKGEIKALISKILSGNLNMLLDMSKIKEKSWCDTASKEYSKTSGMLLSELGKIVLLDGSILESSFSLENMDKSEDDLKQEADEEKKFKKSITRKMTVSTNITRDNLYLYSDFTDMLPGAYSAYIKEMKGKWDTAAKIYKLKDNELVLWNYMKEYIFGLQIDDGSGKLQPLPYYYTLHFLNKPISFYYKSMISLILADATGQPRVITYDSIPMVSNDFFTSYNKINFITNPNYITDFTNLQKAADSITRSFINKYDLIRNQKLNTYYQQFPLIYGHVENRALNTFFERDKLKFQKKQHTRNEIFYLNMILKKIYTAIGNDSNFDIPENVIEKLKGQH